MYPLKRDWFKTHEDNKGETRDCALRIRIIYYRFSDPRFIFYRNFLHSRVRVLKIKNSPLPSNEEKLHETIVSYFRLQFKRYVSVL